MVEGRSKRRKGRPAAKLRREQLQPDPTGNSGVVPLRPASQASIFPCPMALRTRPPWQTPTQVLPALRPWARRPHSPSKVLDCRGAGAGSGGRAPRKPGGAPRAGGELLGGRMALPQCLLHRGLWPLIRGGSRKSSPEEFGWVGVSQGEGWGWFALR